MLQATGGQVKQKPQAAGYALGEPYVAHRAGQLDVAHALAAHLGAGHLHAALIADNALVTYSLVFTAVAFKVLGGTENPLAKESVPFGLEGTVVNGLGLGNLAVRPATYLLR